MDKPHPTEIDVLEDVMNWKHKRRSPLDESTVASTIRNLRIFRWPDVKPDKNLPDPEEESLIA